MEFKVKNNIVKMKIDILICIFALASSSSEGISTPVQTVVPPPWSPHRSDIGQNFISNTKNIEKRINSPSYSESSNSKNNNIHDSSQLDADSGTLHNRVQFIGSSILHQQQSSKLHHNEEPQYKLVTDSSTTTSRPHVAASALLSLQNNLTQKVPIHSKSEVHHPVRAENQRFSPNHRQFLYKNPDVKSNSPDDDLLSRGRRTESNQTSTNGKVNTSYYSYNEKYRDQKKLQASRNIKHERDWANRSYGEWVEYDFDHTTPTTTIDPSLPENPVGLKNPKLLLGPWVEQPQVRVTNARFGNLNGTVVNAQIGTTANLPCVILDRDDHETVSWLRSRDHHLITVGRQTYSSDDRFSVTFNRHLKTWTLHLRYVQPRDAGEYICQLSTDPVMVYVVTLSVTEASSTIKGGSERYVHEGSSVRLECVLQRHTQPPEYVFWYHNGSMINFDSNRKVTVEPSPDGSILTLLSVGRTDSGNYTCSPANAQQASIMLHIILGDTLAAMKVSGASSLGSYSMMLGVMFQAALAIVMCASGSLL